MAFRPGSVPAALRSDDLDASLLLSPEHWASWPRRQAHHLDLLAIAD